MRRFALCLTSLLLLATTPAPVAADEGVPLKAPNRGLMSRAGIPPFPFIDHAVVNVRWADVEPADNQFDWSAIEALRAPGRGLRLRVTAGVESPGFVKALGGPPVSSVDPPIDCSGGGVAVFNDHAGEGGCVPYFWLDGPSGNPVLAQYAELMRALAARYDGQPDILDVVDSACSTVYAEPFIRGDAASTRRLFEAGLDLAADRRCQESALRIHAETFTQTRTSLALNPWQYWGGSDRQPSWAAVYELVDGFARPLLGARLLLQTNGLDGDAACPPGETPATALYCLLGEANPPKGFQTRSQKNLGGTTQDLYDAIERALAMRACFVELPRWADGSELDVARLADYDRRLETNCPDASPLGALRPSLESTAPTPPKTVETARAPAPPTTVTRAAKRATVVASPAAPSAATGIPEMTEAPQPPPAPPPAAPVTDSTGNLAERTITARKGQPADPRGSAHLPTYLLVATAGAVVFMLLRRRRATGDDDSSL